jgi:hypothetical protein
MTLHRLSACAAAACLAISSTACGVGVSAEDATLQNGRVRAVFAGGRLVSLADLRSGDSVRFGDEQFGVTVNGRPVDLSTTSPSLQLGRDTLAVTYAAPDATVTVLYELRADWGFVSKRLRIEPPAMAEFRVNEVRTWAATIDLMPAGTLPLSEGRFGTIVRMPDDGVAGGASLFALHQNPYNVFGLEGGRLDASYAPEMDWNPGDGAFESDRLLLGLVRRSGRVMPASSVPEWLYVADYDRYLRENPVIDEAESLALVDAVRAFLLYRPQRSIRVHVPWCENDYQIDVATSAGWDEYTRILDMASRLGATNTLFTPANSALSSLAENRDAWGWENLLFFALGQKIRKGDWVPGRDAVPASLRSMIDAGAARGLGYLAYAYPSLPFLQDPAWTAWTGGELSGRRGVDTGQRTFQDWWVRTLLDFTTATGAAGFSFDHWWMAIDDPAATSRYAQWAGARRVLEELRRRKPDIVMDGRQQYMNFGPWTWLAGSYPHPTLTDEQPESFVAFPDLHTDRVSANRQRFAAWKYRVERFAPPEIMPGYITHQTERTDGRNVMRRDRFRPRDWDVLGWKFSLFSSIGTAPFNHTISYVPARDEDEFKAFDEADAAFFRRWLDWTDENAGVLRALRPILGPPMIGRVDGTAAIAGDHGFVFLFNPNYRSIDAVFTLDESIGVTERSRFLLRELNPEAGRLRGKPGAGFWSYGDQVHIPMRGTEALVLEVAPAPPTVDVPLLFNVTGRVEMAGAALSITGAQGEPGTSRDVVVLLPPDRMPERVTINGRAVEFRPGDGAVEITAAFEGRPFGRAHGVFRYDPSFAGGTLSGSVVVPQRVFAQLRARKAAWPVPYTDDDLLAPWLGSDRLLLFVQIAEPVDSLAIALTIDGRSVPLARGYNSIYGHAPRRTFLGYYADVSGLAPDVPHRVELTLPPLEPGRFQGLFFENVEPEWTADIRTDQPRNMAGVDRHIGR